MEKGRDEELYNLSLSSDHWDVFHFIGHGGFDEAKQQGLLVFENKDGHVKYIPANQFRMSLPSATKLVVLNACEAARGNPLDHLSSIAHSLACNRIPAVVAMQFKILDSAASWFSKTLYTLLARGTPIDEAVADARWAISKVADEVDRLDWAAPVLYMSSLNVFLFEIRPEREELEKERIERERLEREQRERERQEQEERLEQERREREQREQERFEQERREREQREQKEQLEQKRREQELIKQRRRTKTRRFQLIAGVLGVLLLLATLGGWLLLRSISSPTTFCLATDLPTSGQVAETGRDMQNGVELARMQSPLSTKYHGYEFKKFYMDNASAQDGRPNPATGVQNIQNLLQQSACANPIAIIGPYDSPTAVAEIPLAAQNHILLLSPSNTAPCLTQRTFSDPSTCNYDSIHPQGVSNTYARLPGDDTVEGSVVVDVLLASPNSQNPGQVGLRAQRIAIVGDEEIYGTQLSQAVIQGLRSRGVDPVEIDCVKPRNEYKLDRSCSLNSGTDAFSIEDNRAELAVKLRDKHPDVIFFGGRPDRGAGLLRQHLGLLGLGELPFMGGSAFVANKSELFKNLGSYTANIYAAFSAPDPSTFTFGTAETFSKKYQEVFLKSPGAYSANGYDAANIILQAIKTLIDTGKPVTRESVFQAVLSTNFVGVTGNYISFNQNGDNVGQRVYTIYQSQRQSQGTWDFKVLAQQIK